MAKTITFTQDTSGHELNVYLYPDGDLSGCTELLALGDNPNYLCVDEDRTVPDEDETYVYWNSPVLKSDLYSLPNKYSLGTVNYVQVYVRAKSADEAQHADGVYKIICSPDSVCTHIYKSDDIGLTTGYKNYFKVWTENPATSTSWTGTDINALCIGMECNSPAISAIQSLTIRPNAVGTYAQLNKSGCVSNYECVDEENKDDDVTHVYPGTSIGYKDDSYDLENHTTESGTITKITVFAWMKLYKTGEITPPNESWLSILTGGSTYYSPSFKPTTSVYTLYSWTQTVNPNTSLAWTWGNMDNLETGLKLSPASHDGHVKCTQLYVVVEHTESPNPEIRTTQCYAKVNYSSPTDTVTCLNCPEEVSTNYANNIKMMNMWNGDRVVYSLNRSGKSMVLTGYEFAVDYRNESTVTQGFYFTKYEPPIEWQNNPERMVNGVLTSYASTSVDEQIQLLTANNCDGAYKGKITKVEVRFYGYAGFLVGGRHIRVKPILNGETDFTGIYDYQFGTTPQWSSWFNITNDTSAPATWDWEDVENLDAKIWIVEGLNLTMYISKVEIKVTHHENTCPLKSAVDKIKDINTMAKRGYDVTIDDFSFCAFNGAYKIRSVGWDVIQKKPLMYKYYVELEDSEL